MSRKAITTGALLIAAMAVQADVAIGPQIITTGTEIKVLGPAVDIQAINNGIVDAGPMKRYLIRLGPGEYTITADGTTGLGLEMIPYVSIKGSGQEVTILKGAITSTTQDGTSAIVSGANNASLTDLSVENTGGSSYSTAIYNFSASPHIRNVTAAASGALSFNVGVQNTDSSSTVMSHVTATAAGSASTVNCGVYNNHSSSPTMSDMTASATGGASSYGVCSFNSSSPTLRNMTATASGGATTNRGVYTTGSSMTMINVIATGFGGPNPYGVLSEFSTDVFMSNVTAAAWDGSASIRGLRINGGSAQIDSSTLSGTLGDNGTGVTYGIHGITEFTRITNTRIIGAILGDHAATNCRDTFDADLADVSC